MTTHGTITAYNKGCRCGDCRRANAVKKERWKLRTRHGAAPVFVDAQPVIAHIEALKASGWTYRDVSREIGRHPRAVAHILQWHNRGQRFVRRDTAAAILAIDPLEPVTFDTVLVDRFVNGEADWRQLTIDERCEAARRMDRAGISRNVIAERTHLNSRTLWAAFDAEEIAS